jgi:hypothetical protein
MVGEARPYFQAYPLLILAPGLAILLTVVNINLLADNLRDLLDPRSGNHARSWKAARALVAGKDHTHDLQPTRPDPATSGCPLEPTRARV